MEEYPIITVVTPVYNQVQYLEKTILSIVNQKYPNLEYIIIDGGSSDGSVDIIKKYEKYLTYWVSEPDSGMYDAIQKGFDKSTGEIMCWLNADDVFLCNSLFAVSKVFMKNPSFNWITSHHTVIDENDVITFVKPTKQYCKYHFYLQNKPWRHHEIGQESTFWRRSLWERAGAKMNKSFRLAGDYELWLRFFQYDTLHVVSSAFAAFRVRSGQLSSDMNSYYEETDLANDSMPLCKSELNICRRYERRMKIADFIDKFKILNGKRICRLARFENKYFNIPPIVYV